MTKAHDGAKLVAEQYARYFETLNPSTLEEAHPIISDDIHFVDPFNDVRGRKNFMRVVEKMFEDVKDPRFEILDLAWSGDLCFMRWDFFCEMPKIGAWSVRGMTELHFNDQGYVSAHYDYWDASRHFYAKLPVIGWLIGLIVKKAAIDPSQEET